MPYLRKVDRKSVRLAIKKTAATPCSGFRCRDPSAVPLWLPAAAGDRIAPEPTRFFRFSRLQTASGRLPQDAPDFNSKEVLRIPRRSCCGSSGALLLRSISAAREQPSAFWSRGQRPRLQRLRFGCSRARWALRLLVRKPGSAPPATAAAVWLSSGTVGPAAVGSEAGVSAPVYSGCGLVVPGTMGPAAVGSEAGVSAPGYSGCGLVVAGHGGPGGCWFGSRGQRPRPAREQPARDRAACYGTAAWI